jgi:hypothetical protein
LKENAQNFFEDYRNLHIQTHLELDDMSECHDVNKEKKTFMDKMFCKALKSHNVVVVEDNAFLASCLKSTILLQAIWNIDKQNDSYYINIGLLKILMGMLALMEEALVKFEIILIIKPNFNQGHEGLSYAGQ